jgi:hypothetical protein
LSVDRFLFHQRLSVGIQVQVLCAEQAIAALRGEAMAAAFAVPRMLSVQASSR